MTGRVDAVARKPAKGAPMESPPSLTLRTGVGIDGDCSAQPDSCRQVLMVDGAVLDAVGLPCGALRENLTVRGIALDALGSGTALSVGHDVVLRLTVPCDPCGPLGRYVDVDRRELTGRRGMLAVVAHGGEVRVGDAVVDRGVIYDPIPVAPMRRVEWVARHVPAGKVVTFDQVRRATGMAKGYVRTMPRHVRRLMAEGAPAHRVVPDNPGASLQPGQADALRAEGVAVDDDERTGKRQGWPFVDPWFAPAPHPS